MTNVKIRKLYRLWKFNGDLMTCQNCGVSTIAARMHKPAHHVAGCKNENTKNPWLELAEILHEVKIKPYSKYI